MTKHDNSWKACSGITYATKPHKITLLIHYFLQAENIDLVIG